MRKYKTSFLGIAVLVNQDEIDEHAATMEKWREGKLDDNVGFHLGWWLTDTVSKLKWWK